MPAFDAISAGQLARLIPTPRCPTLPDNRDDALRVQDARLPPAARALTKADMAPEAPGLLAVPPALSRIYATNREQLDAAIILDDAFYRWCRHATGGTHDRPTKKPAVAT